MQIYKYLSEHSTFLLIFYIYLNKTFRLMIDGDKAVTYLKSKIINLINNGSLNATYEESEHTISFYLFDIQNEKRPLLTLRLSNHHENFSNRNKKGRELPKGDDNLSIELYKPSKKQNRVRTNVRICYNVEKPNIEPFSVTVIEYYPQLMYGNDVNLIYQSILNWIKSKNTSAKYIDPLMNTSRRANIATKHADIHTYRYVTQAEKNFYLRYGMGDSVEPKYNIITENRQYKMKQKIRLTEGDLHRIIRNCVNEALNELDARTYASYANKRQAQANNSQNSEDAFRYQQKANAGVNAAQNAWNQKYGFSYNNGGNDWGEQSMGGNNNFTHNGNTNYGINYRSEKPNLDGNGYTHTNMAYNPQNNTIWKGNGQGEENVRQSNSEYEMGDNGAYKTARQMQNPNPQRDYVKGQGWR